jgi:transposase InsO family protein
MGNRIEYILAANTMKEAAMGWREVTVRTERKEFVALALKEGVNFSELCRRFGISSKTGYKFVKRYKEEGLEGLNDRSRRPKSSPGRTSSSVEGLILGLRDKHPRWGGRKLRRRLMEMGHEGIASASTITAILKRNGRISEEESEKHKAWQRFESDRPNDLWQMDFKGHFPLREGRCHPLTIVDDHSRYSLCIGACEDERKETVEKHLRDVFERYGMPWAILMDNGNPWGGSERREYTSLTIWLMRLGIGVLHSSPHHPQTLGKDERFHRTMRGEVVWKCEGKTIEESRKLLEDWRMVYNTERPHEAIGMQVPAERYRPSERSFPERWPEIEYGLSDVVRKVQDEGLLHYKGRRFKVSKALRGQPVAIRPSGEDQVYDVFFCNQRIAQISLI